MKFRFGFVDSAIGKVVGQFPGEFLPNEAHSYSDRVQHKDINVSHKEVQANLKEMRVPGFYADPLLLFPNFSANVRPCESLTELVLELEEIELPQRSLMIFRASHLVVAKQSPLLLQYGIKK